ncbi:adenylate/guanylate cyclase domain-containing protein [Planotetraspora sp. A-T 1434]|uniref:adenylate/guanylate cyclase domain-containing protein n=1 Tax=Planotetraspora sp. A-T 1434 TaxID=2979219 RepID=UPI0021BEFA56|nr:adenylate/guanylate cyclase domain-containing protein [Planotetraspora sp. A-T 1434]MCT9934088.1 adenylate/guanylate cyclase domain-containing protein [Planotetraspora sp. A-T 1434]
MRDPSPAEHAPSREPYLPPATQPVRAIVWSIHLVLPLLGLWLLLAQPDLDIEWHDNFSHFWLILVVAGVNVVLGGLISQASARRGDARLLLVSLVFLSSAGFFLLHGLATPGLLHPKGTVGFDLAQPVGLTIASVIAFVSALPLGDRAASAVLRSQAALRTALSVVLVAWGVASLVPGLTPLSDPLPPGGVGLGGLSLVGVALYAASAAMMFRLHRRRPAAVLISLITAYALLAEAMIAGMSHHNWHLSWWEWHLLLTLAFLFVAYSAYLQFRREGATAGLFDGVTLAATVRRIREEYEEALEELVGHLRRRTESGVPVATRLAGRFRLTEGQAAVLDRAGAALAAERDLSERLGALVDVGRRNRVGLPESDLLATALDRVRQAYGDVRLSLMRDGRLIPYGSAGPEPRHDLRALAEGAVIAEEGRVVHPLTVKGRLAGALSVPVGVTAQDEALAATLAGQMSISLENARLYQELDTLFRQYMSPAVASSLLADPGQAALGGKLVEVTALFADLRGFTTFSERVSPGEIVEMLNRYHTAAVPCILGNDGTIVQFVGDALLALFNAPVRQGDHAAKAVQAALEMQEAAAEVSRQVVAEQAAGLLADVEWPTFRVGVNTGMALVGNIGSPEFRGFNAMGDAVNVAARLQALAEPGTVVIGQATRDRIGPAKVVSLGDLSLKGKEQTVHAYRLITLG